MERLCRASIWTAKHCRRPQSRLISSTSTKLLKIFRRFKSSAAVAHPKSIEKSRDSRRRISNFWITTGGVTTAAGEQDATHQLLVRGGFLRQAHAGIFHLLPLGLRVQEKIERLVEKHMHSVGAHKLALSSITSEALWTKSGRYTGNNPELFKLWGNSSTGLLLSPTHEEEITQLVSGLVKSYKDLPLRLYQIGRKYRNERRPRRGLLRGREFLMKDLYTFDKDNEAALETYRQVKEAYANIFDELGVSYLIVEADSGNMGGSLSHEFQCIGVDGEDLVISCDTCTYASNQEVLEADSIESGDTCPSCKHGKVTVHKAIELGHTFHLGTRYSEPFGAKVEVPTATKSSGVATEVVPLSMGCHGIGISRLIAAVAESLRDETGLQWPRAIAPFEVIIMPAPGHDEDACRVYDAIVEHSAAESAYGGMVEANFSRRTEPIDIAIDDRDKRSGWLFKDAELLGIPVLVVMHRPKENQETQTCEIRCRRLYPQSVHLALDQVPEFVRNCLQQL